MRWKKYRWILEIDISRNQVQQNLGVLRGDFEGLDVQKTIDQHPLTNNIL